MRSYWEYSPTSFDCISTVIRCLAEKYLFNMMNENKNVNYLSCCGLYITHYKMERTDGQHHELCKLKKNGKTEHHILYTLHCCYITYILLLYVTTTI